MLVLFVFLFFFKQKTAYEMRISDWSSDVCSSDLCCGGKGQGQGAALFVLALTDLVVGCDLDVVAAAGVGLDESQARATGKHPGKQARQHQAGDEAAHGDRLRPLHPWPPANA